MLTLNSSTIFVADMVIYFGRYGLFVWPMWLWPLWFVADMVCGRYSTDPKYNADMQMFERVKCGRLCG